MFTHVAVQGDDNPSNRRDVATALRAVETLFLQLQDLESGAVPGNLGGVAERSVGEVAGDILRAARAAARAALPLLECELCDAAAATTRLRKQFPWVTEHAWEDAYQDTLLALMGRLADLMQGPVENLSGYAVSVMQNRLQQQLRLERREEPLGAHPGLEPVAPATTDTAFDPDAFADHLNRQIQPVAPVTFAELFRLLMRGGETPEQIARRFRMSVAKVRHMVDAIAGFKRTFRS